LDATQVVTVGDTKDDMMAGKQAGTVTILIENEGIDESARRWSDLHLKSLHDVLVLFQTVFEKPC
jgi:phosphoglycolate phosphatase-like HAD superfamily hydrolase